MEGSPKLKIADFGNIERKKKLKSLNDSQTKASNQA